MKGLGSFCWLGFFPLFRSFRSFSLTFCCPFSNQNSICSCWLSHSWCSHCKSFKAISTVSSLDWFWKQKNYDYQNKIIAMIKSVHLLSVLSRFWLIRPGWTFLTEPKSGNSRSRILSGCPGCPNFPVLKGGGPNANPNGHKAIMITMIEKNFMIDPSIWVDTDRMVRLLL